MKGFIAAVIVWILVCIFSLALVLTSMRKSDSPGFESAVISLFASMFSDGLTEDERALRERDRRETRGRAIVEKQFAEVIRSSLLAPSTAKVVTASEVSDDHTQIIVIVQVDAQNAFGAMLRKHWKAVYDAGSLENLTIKALD
jgi:hypothetical protein